MALIDGMRRQQRRMEARQAAQIGVLYRDAYRRLQPAIRAVTDVVGQAEHGMSGREIVESAAFAALMQQTMETFGEFGRQLYAVTIEGVRSQAAQGLSDAQALMLEPVHPSGRARAEALLTMPTVDDVLGSVAHD